MSKEIKVLYVDDEASNLRSFKAAFRMDYTIFTAENTDLAMDILNKHEDIHIVISDQRMPGKTGVEFFNELKETHKKPVRMLLTAYADINSVIDAINSGRVFRYVSKPWNENEVIMAIEEAYVYYQTNSLLQEKMVQLQESYDALDRFTYAITHDIRGPILSILRALTLLNPDEDNQQKEIIEIIEKSVSRIDNLIVSTHDYYKVTHGNPVMEPVMFDSLMDDLLQIHYLQAYLYKIKIDLKIDQSEAFMTDKALLRIILNNLISNAFKYQVAENADKRVWINIHVSDKTTVIEVKDNGIGINENYIDKIFDIFYRATNNGVGSGFGLYNVKDAISKLGGNIEVDSVQGQGSKFVVTLKEGVVSEGVDLAMSPALK